MKRRSLSKAQSAAYQGAMEAAFAVPVAVGIGYWVDKTFGTTPRGVVIGAIVGFGAMVLRLSRMRPGEPEPGDETEADEAPPPATAEADEPDEGPRLWYGDLSGDASEDESSESIKESIKESRDDERSRESS